METAYFFSLINAALNLGNASCKGCITGKPFSLILITPSSVFSCLEQDEKVAIRQ